MSGSANNPDANSNSKNGRPWRVLMYVQHLSGIGHQHRSARIARALTAHGFRVTYVSGGMPVPGLDIGASEGVQLMPVRARDQRYQELLDASGRTVNEAWKLARREQLLAVLERSCADVVMVETYPFGRKLMRFELEPLVERIAALRPRPLLLCSVRDILEPRAEIQRYSPMADQVERYFDHVLVHADPALFTFADTFPLYDRIRDKVIYTGYISEAGLGAQDALVLSSDHGSDHDYRGAVIISAGGGATGETLLKTAFEARSLSRLRDRRWLLLAGPNFPEAVYAALQARTQAGIEVQRNRANFRDLLAACQVSVSQAGYNTMLDLLVTGARSVLVPFARYSEREQLVRARHLEALQLASVVNADDLNPGSLAVAIDAAALRPKMEPMALDVAGAQYCVRLLQALLCGDEIPVRSAA